MLVEMVFIDTSLTQTKQSNLSLVRLDSFDSQREVVAATVDDGVLEGWKHVWFNGASKELILSWLNNREGVNYGIQIDGKWAGARSLYTQYGGSQKGTILSTGGWLKEEYRGLGYGKKVLQMVIEIAQTLDHPLLETGTNPDNISAQKNLEACGFKLQGFAGSNYLYSITL